MGVIFKKHRWENKTTRKRIKEQGHSKVGTSSNTLLSGNHPRVDESQITPPGLLHFGKEKQASAGLSRQELSHWRSVLRQKQLDSYNQWCQISILR